jgi:hypothetical protein
MIRIMGIKRDVVTHAIEYIAFMTIFMVRTHSLRENSLKDKDDEKRGRGRS